MSDLRSRETVACDLNYKTLASIYEWGDYGIILQSVSWILAEFRHNKIVQLPLENCFNVCRQLQRKVRSRKHDV